MYLKLYPLAILLLILSILKTNKTTELLALLVQVANFISLSLPAKAVLWYASCKPLIKITIPFDEYTQYSTLENDHQRLTTTLWTSVVTFTARSCQSAPAYSTICDNTKIGQYRSFTLSLWYVQVCR